MNAGVASLEGTSGKGISSLWIVLILVAPAILDFVLVPFAGNSNQSGLMILWVTFLGTPVAGIVSAILLVRRRTESWDSPSIGKVVLLSILLTVISFALCFAGCAGGFALSGK